MKKLEKEIDSILLKVQKLKNNPQVEDSRLPENCFVPDERTAVCFSRKNGDSRYPYNNDGFALWAYASGSICINESAFYTVLPSTGGKEPFVSFFGGIKSKGKNTFDPISVFGLTRQPNEAEVERYTVYTPEAVYYFADTPKALFVVRAFVAGKREVYFSLYARNKTKDALDVYLMSYINCLLKHDTMEHIETNWFRECAKTDTGFVFESVEDIDRTTHLTHFGVLRRSVHGKPTRHCTTTARSVFTGGVNNPIYCADSLYSGRFEAVKDNTKFTDTPIGSDIVEFELGGGKCVCIDYGLNIISDRSEAKKLSQSPLAAGLADKAWENVYKAYAAKNSGDGMLQIEFGGDKNGMDGISPKALNRFLSFVIRQVEFGALSKNSGVSLLGVRDVFQQIEAALIWTPKECRAKIIEALGFIDPSGRPPRQYSLPKEGALPMMDLRPFIDQGVWIINTVYTYLSYTGDYSILDEECGYYEFLSGNSVRQIDLVDSVLNHLIRIMDYLIQNIDTTTGCLRAIYGDWNDALDGLGTTDDPDKEYGSGVSVMASLQLYQNLSEMTEILTKANIGAELIDRYSEVKVSLKEGLVRYALQKNGKGDTRILHGWGDKMSYNVGSFCDPDGANRYSLTSNAFWVIAGAYKWDNSIKSTILDTYNRLDSKYGLKTFEPYFAKGVKGVGRIPNLPKGTAENAATYIHATVFGIWSLFLMGEPKLAWEQLVKILPINHDIMSTTPFVMPNSYSYNEEYGMDGESMSDWYTGSANTLIKVLVKFVLGLQPKLDGVRLQPAKYIPSDFEASAKVKGTPIRIKYLGGNSGKRIMKVDGKEIPTEYDEYMDTQILFLPDSLLRGRIINIEILD